MKKLVFLGLLSIILCSCQNKNLLEFSVFNSGYSVLHCPVSLNIDTLGYDIPEHLELIELTNKKNKIPFQLEFGKEAQLWFIIDSMTAPEQQIDYILRECKKSQSKINIKVKITEEEIVLSYDKKDKFSFQKKPIIISSDIDLCLYKTGYLHTIRTLGAYTFCKKNNCSTLPSGIWSAWEKTSLNNTNINYWDLSKGSGTVNYKSIYFIDEGSIFGGFSIKNSHVQIQNNKTTDPNINEIIHYRFWNVNSADKYLLDINSQFWNTKRDTITLCQSDLGGFSLYAETSLFKKTSLNPCSNQETISTEETPQWIRLENDSPTQNAGVILLNHTGNYDYSSTIFQPENNSECSLKLLNINPVANKYWNIYPKQANSLKYRLVVFDGKVSNKQSDMIWNAYVHPPNAVITHVRR